MSQSSLYNNAVESSLHKTEVKKHYLINRSIDVFLLGGASVIFFLMATFLMPRHYYPYAIKVIFFLNFIVNFPHFLLSYQLLYWDFRYLIFKKIRYFWAGVVIPFILIFTFAFAAQYKPIISLGYFVNALYFFVGWHYIKQIFGTIVVTNALQKFFYTKFERLCLQANLYTLWGISWVWTNAGNGQSIFEGIIYSSLNMPKHFILYSFDAIIFTLMLVLILHLKKYIQERRKPALAAVVCFISSYFWFVPLFYNPVFFLYVAFFHSLQYLPFVFVFRRNKLKQQMKRDLAFTQNLYYLQHYGYLLLSIILGAFCFYFFPRYIDQKKLFDFDLYGPTLIMFYSVIFLNIHHYFIDNVLWRKSNDDMQKYIFNH